MGPLYLIFKTMYAGDMGDKIFSVSGFLDYINDLIGQEPVAVQGEVSSWKLHPSGVYFSLKDTQSEEGTEALLECYMSPFVFRTLGIAVEEGMEIKAVGLPSIYKPKGRFSFRVEHIELVGEGSLKKAYELLKRTLEQEGLFARKRPLPEFVQRIAVITSKTGAVIDDFRKNLERYGFHISLRSVRVEGAQAVKQITAAIQGFNAHAEDYDALVVMRSGGSLEDLQPFNNELVARAIFGSAIPTIVAIGHDRDVPIASLIGDAMTSTPTAAAILVNRSWDRLVRDVPQLQMHLLNRFEHALEDIHNRMEFRTPIRIIEDGIATFRESLKRFGQYLASADPQRNLERGYSVTMDGKGRVIHSTKDVQYDDMLHTRLAEGTILSKVQESD